MLGSKFTKFLSFLKQKISFFQILRYFSMLWDITPLYLFYLKFYTNLVKFQMSSRKSEILHFSGFLLSKSYKVSPKTWGIELNFIRAPKNLKNYTFMGPFCLNYIMFQLENFIEIMCHDTEGWCKISWKFEGNLTLGLKKNIKNLVNFHAINRKFAIWWAPFVRSIYCLSKRIQWSYVSWHWRVMQYLKKNWLVFWKMTKGIWLIFMGASTSLKTWTLMGSFCPKHIKF